MKVQVWKRSVLLRRKFLPETGGEVSLDSSKADFSLNLRRRVNHHPGGLRESKAKLH